MIPSVRVEFRFIDFAGFVDRPDVLWKSLYPIATYHATCDTAPEQLPGFPAFNYADIVTYGLMGPRRGRRVETIVRWTCFVVSTTGIARLAKHTFDIARPQRSDLALRVI